ncbi:carbohydrate-selective porin OprB [Neokomagataea thailandica NBRC 106555]|uniref:Carbohydrate-selective porin OprB n=1 Tax=Neokomagataea thailandica NBRC 106555 TaxID=1223520 RepID=A0ABQ0QN71_9PROT|nr:MULTISPECIES: carbohydrate porin [Neokomagataea]GBR51188.1 carbohydrate-selective porin OprB [Neokomagataea thailandica NBRC 106555]
MGLFAALAFGQKVKAIPASSPLTQTTDAVPDTLETTDVFALHAQSTLVWQGHNTFNAPYSGPQSLKPAARGAETWDLTLFTGLHPWKGGEIWVNGEVDQGFGLGNTLGIAGFSSGEAYKLGRGTPYFRVQRAFFRQTFNFSGTTEKIPSDLNQFSIHQSSNRLVITAGKFSIPDLYDNNTYAHDPRSDFLNWSLIDTGTFDYAADSWGYTTGIATEWFQGRWTLRSGLFLMSVIPNSPDTDTSFKNFQIDEELEERHSIGSLPGKILLTAFNSHAHMGRFKDALLLSALTNTPASTADVRKMGNRPGVSMTLEQSLSANIAIFLRAGWADGHYESYEFTDIDRTLAGGASLDGAAWHRQNDRIGLAYVMNAASGLRKKYLNAGGTGLLVGDGILPHAGNEHIVEAYYDLAVSNIGHITLDYQWVGNPAYNMDRGPVSIFGGRVHSEF